MAARHLALLLLLGCEPAAAADPVSRAEAYRLDALETKALNEAAQAKLGAGVRRDAPTVARPPVALTPGERALAGRVDAAIARWRERRQRCLEGHRRDCD